MMHHQNPYKAILAIVIGFIVLFLIFKKTALLLVATAIGVLALISAKAAQLIYKYWMQLAQLLGRVNTTILLTLIFFLLLTPIALIYRLIHKNPLQLKKDTSENSSYYKIRNHTYTAEDLKKMW